MTPRLLLYIEEDYILPLAIDADGKVHEYAKDDENRLWLYFYCAEHSVDNALKYRTNVAAEEYGYYGNFFENMEKGATAIIDGSDLPYFDLLSLSLVLKNIRRFYEENTGDTSVNISTSFVFAESIGVDGRRKFLDGMNRNGFVPISFSKSLTAVLLDYAEKSMPEVKFGDNVLLVTSASDTLRLTSAVFDGDKWLTDGTCEVVTAVGDSPLKTAFVRYVVDQVDKNRGYLTTKEKREREYEFQYPNADEWFSRADDTGNIFIKDFSYSFDPEVKYTCEVKRSFLAAVQEKAVRDAVSQILAYKKRFMDKHMVCAVLCGPAFDDVEFVNMMRSSLGNPSYICVPSHVMPSALTVFFNRYYELEESFEKYDSVVTAMRNSRAAIATWVESAGKIRSLWESLNETVPELESAFAEDFKHLEEMLKSCDDMLSSSDFKRAYEVLTLYPIPSMRTSAASHGVNECLRKLNELQPVFAKVRAIDGARVVIERIEAVCRQVTAEDGIMTMVKALPQVLDRKRDDGACGDGQTRDSVAYYESHYDEYISLKSRFNVSNSIKEKRELIERMKEVTKEQLPDLTIRHVAVELSAELKMEKTGFLGLKKKKELHYGMKVKGKETLPCDAVINISNNVQQRANDGSSTCVAVEVAKGESRYEGVLPLPDSRIQEDKPIYVFLFVAPDVLDKRALESDPPYRIVKQ